MKKVSTFISNGWHLHAVDARYSDGVLVGMSQRSDLLLDILDFDSGADIESAGLSEYLLNTGAWLPVSFGSDLNEALESLESKLANLNPERRAYGSDWSEAVNTAYQAVIDASDGSYGIAMAIDSGKLLTAPTN